MEPYHGWWYFDKTSPSLVNKVSGQRVAYVEHMADDPSLNIFSSSKRQWMRFTYSDHEIQYPVVVEARHVRKNTSRTERHNVWRVDHIRSAKLWKRETGQENDHPPHNLWQRLDDCLCDAFGCWPQDALDPPFEEVSIAGGWYAGRWTHQLYRHLSYLIGTAGTKRLAPTLIGKNSSFASTETTVLAELRTPTTWEFVPHSGNRICHDPTDWGFERDNAGRLHLPEGHTLEKIEHSHPHLRSTDHKSFIIPLTVHYNSSTPEVYPGEPYIGLLYVDEHLTCDGMFITKSDGTMELVFGFTPSPAGLRFRRPDFPDQGFPEFVQPDRPRDALRPFLRLFSKSERKEVADPRAPVMYMQDGDAKPCPGTICPLPADDGPYFYRWQPPLNIWNYLTSRVCEAWLQWQSSEVSLPENRTGISQDHTINTATSIMVSRPVGGEYLQSVKSTIAIAVGDNFSKFRTPMRSIFEDDYDGQFRSVRGAKVYGWWDFDPEGPALVNRTSGQRVSFDGNGTSTSTREPGQSSDACLGFTYSDEEVSYPLQVSFCELNNTVFRTKAPGRDFLIDHNACAEYWRNSTGASIAYPSYGLWTRVDECVRDALACWPEIEETGIISDNVVTTGGWLNGAWDDTYHRVKCAQVLPDGRDNQDLLVTAIMEPLNASPDVWEFVDTREIDRSARFLDLPIDKFEERLTGVYYLPPDLPLDDESHKMPHLRRADGRAVMIPVSIRWQTQAGLSHHWNVRVLYADFDVVCTFDAQWDLAGGRASRVFSLRNVLSTLSFRHADIDPALRPLVKRVPSILDTQRDKPYYDAPVMSLALWRRLTNALSSGWTQWRGTDRSINATLEEQEYIRRTITITRNNSEDLIGVNLKGSRTAYLKENYVGGIFSFIGNLEMFSRK